MATPRGWRVLMGVAVVLASLAVGACTRSASTPAAPAEGGETPQAQNWQQQTMEAVRFALLTQTAQAGGEGAATTPTATVAVPVSSGTPDAAQSTPGATQPIAPPSTPPPLTRPDTYTLQEGEFPYCIARRYNVDPLELLSLSGLSFGEMYPPGTLLRIPQTGSFPGSRALISHPASYSVVSGDTIYSVACIYGDVDPLAIASANNLSSPYTLIPGSTIRIP